MNCFACGSEPFPSSCACRAMRFSNGYFKFIVNAPVPPDPEKLEAAFQLVMEKARKHTESLGKVWDPIRWAPYFRTETLKEMSNETEEIGLRCNGKFLERLKVMEPFWDPVPEEERDDVLASFLSRVRSYVVEHSMDS